MPVLNKKPRDTRGTSTAEFPMALGILLLFILFPLIDLGSIALGTSSVHNAARVGATEASRGQSCNDAITKGKTFATSQATGGVTITQDDVQVTAQKVKILDTDQAAPEEITPLPTAQEIDKSQYIYQIKVTVTGQVRPIILLSTFFGNIPGLTQPLTVTAESTATFENPFNLAK